MVLHLVGQYLLLRLISMFEEFLDHVVAEDVGHQLYSIGGELSEDLIFFVAIGSLQLLLDESRAMLVTTEFNDIAIDILNDD